MHSMHRLFLTNRTLYVIVTNARDNKANEQALYWIRNIKSFANGAPVLLLVNQIDQNPSANVNENVLRTEYPALKDVHIISALRDSKEKFLSAVSYSICRIVSGMESVHTLFSSSWLALMNDLQNMPEDVIKSQDFYEKCKIHNIGTDKALLNQIIGWYQDLGVCFYSRRHPISAQYMVLKPRWLLNALYILIFNGRKYAKNGIIPETAIYDLLCEKVPDDVIRKVWNTHQNDPFEHYFQTVIFLVFTLLDKFTLCEMHTNTGRIDCVVQAKKYIYIFEFKRDETAESALIQINKKNYALPFKANNRKIIKVGVNFDSKTKNIDGWLTDSEA